MKSYLHSCGKQSKETRIAINMRQFHQLIPRCDGRTTATTQVFFELQRQGKRQRTKFRSNQGNRALISPSHYGTLYYESMGEESCEIHRTSYQHESFCIRLFFIATLCFLQVRSQRVYAVWPRVTPGINSTRGARV